MKDFPLWRSPRAGAVGALLLILPMIVFSLSPLTVGYLVSTVLFLWPVALCLGGLAGGSLPLALGAAAALLALWRSLGGPGLMLGAVYLLPIVAVFVLIILRRMPFRRGCFLMIGVHVAALAAVYWLLQRLAGGDLYAQAGRMAMDGLGSWEMGDSILYQLYEMGLLELPSSLAGSALISVPGGYVLSDAARQDLLLSAGALVTSSLSAMVPGLIVRQSILGGVGCLLLPLRLGYVAQEKREATGRAPLEETGREGKHALRFPDLGMPPFRQWHLPQGMGWQAGLALAAGYALQMSAVPALGIAGIMLHAAAEAVWSIQGAALINYTQHIRGTKRFWRVLIPLVLLSTSLLVFAGIFDQITNVRGLRKPREPKEES